MKTKIDMEAAADRLGGAELTGVLAADLRVVSLDFVQGTPSTHILLAEQVGIFVEASKRLHFNPGVNPATGVETSRIWRIRSSTLMAHGPYWWSTPNLGDNGQPDGALIIRDGLGDTLWIDETHEVLA